MSGKPARHDRTGSVSCKVVLYGNTSAEGKAMMEFRASNAKKPRLPAEKARRQGNITTLAFLLLGGKDGALAFLNSTNRKLGARPIDLAIASDEGYALVEQAIRRTAASRTTSG